MTKGRKKKLRRHAKMKHCPDDEHIRIKDGLNIVDTLSKSIGTKVKVMKRLFPDQPPEDDYGNKEYKWKLIPESQIARNKRCHKMATQIKFRLHEGQGKAVYFLGVLDDGHANGISIDDLCQTISVLIEAVTIIHGTVITGLNFYVAKNGYIATVKIKNNHLNYDTL